MSVAAGGEADGVDFWIRILRMMRMRRMLIRRMLRLRLMRLRLRLRLMRLRLRLSLRLHARTAKYFTGGIYPSEKSIKEAWMIGCLDAWMLGCLDGWMPGCLDGWMPGWLDGWTPECLPDHTFLAGDSQKMLSF